MSPLSTEEAPQKTVRKPDLQPPAASAGKRKSRAVLWCVIGAVALGIAAIAYTTHHATQSAARSRGGPGGMGGPLPVVVRPASKEDVNVYLEGLGTVTPLATVTVRTQINGQLVQVNFAEGQLVNKGDLLAVIDPRPYQAALEQAQGQLMQAQAQLREGQIDLDRYTTLSSQDSISKQQVDAQRALVSQFEGTAKTDQGIVDNAQLNLDYCHITAPSSGRVGLRLVDQGNYVTAGDTSGLVVLTQIKPTTVIFGLPEDNIPAVQKRIASKAAISVDAYDRTGATKVASGILTTIDNTVDPTTGMFKARAVFTNDDEALFPNQFVKIRMLLDVRKGATVVATSAIERGQQGSFVYVVGPDDTVSARTVTLGTTEGERVEVLQGIKLGESVVVDGADRLKDGMAVKPQGPGGPAAGGKPAAGGDGAKHWKKKSGD
jgi:multidrug efflux system membrane fusion protein